MPRVPASPPVSPLFEDGEVAAVPAGHAGFRSSFLRRGSGRLASEFSEVGWGLKLQVGFWGLFALGAIPIAVPIFGTLGGALAFAGTRTAFGLLATSLMMPLFRWVRISPRWPVLRVAVLLGSLSLLATGDIALSEAAAPRLGLTQPNHPIQLLRPGAPFFRVFTYGAWTVAYFGFAGIEERRRARQRAALIEREDRLAEARRLTAQLNPHFLLNSLNAILAEKNNPAVVEALTQSLADFLVFSLRQGSGLAPLGTELQALESYLAVEKIRFEERLEYTIAADEAARAAAVPTALVLPLLENAIKYGQATSPLPLRLHISARLDPDSLVIEVANSGTWVEKGDLSGEGIGLANLNRRLELFYPGLARLDRLPVSAGEVRLRITLPASRAPLLT